MRKEGIEVRTDEKVEIHRVAAVPVIVVDHGCSCHAFEIVLTFDYLG